LTDGTRFGQPALTRQEGRERLNDLAGARIEGPPWPAAPDAGLMSETPGVHFVQREPRVGATKYEKKNT